MKKNTKDFPISSKRCAFVRSVRMYDSESPMDKQYEDICLHPKNRRSRSTLHCCVENCPPPDTSKGESFPKKHNRTPEEIGKEKGIDANIIRVKKRLHAQKMNLISKYLKNHSNEWISPVEMKGYLSDAIKSDKKITVEYAAQLMKKLFDYPVKYGIDIKYFKVIREKRFLHGRRGYCYKFLAKKTT